MSRARSETGVFLRELRDGRHLPQARERMDRFLGTKHPAVRNSLASIATTVWKKEP